MALHLTIHQSRYGLVLCRSWVALIALGSLTACSLQSFEYLSKGGAGTVGGSEMSGGASNESPQGGFANEGGSTNVGGSADAGAASSLGGSTSLGGTTASAGAVNAGGVSSGGTSAKPVSTSNGGADLSGCAFAQTGGQLLVPPSQGFETEIGAWSTTSGNASELSRVAGNGENCEGDWYMKCDGAKRQQAWDGPALEVGPYVAVGHSYVFSVAVRQSPSSYSGAAISMKLVVSETCSGVTYQDLVVQPPNIQFMPVQSNWVRMSGPFTVVAPSGCTVPSSVRLYVASNETASPWASFDVDDFKLIDMTPSATGTGGAPGAG